MDALSCCICGPDKKGSDSKGIEPMFFPIPYAVASSIAHLAREEKVVARKRRDAWLKLLRDNVKKYPGGKVSSHICSLHFHSGDCCFCFHIIKYYITIYTDDGHSSHIMNL